MVPTPRSILARAPIFFGYSLLPFITRGCAQARDKATAYIVQWASGWLALSGAGGGTRVFDLFLSFLFFSCTFFRFFLRDREIEREGGVGGFGRLEGWVLFTRT